MLEQPEGEVTGLNHNVVTDILLVREWKKKQRPGVASVIYNIIVSTRDYTLNLLICKAFFSSFFPILKFFQLKIKTWFSYRGLIPKAPS